MNFAKKILSTSVLDKNDVVASLVVFIVALPLTLGIALASGVSVESSIIAAVIGGIVVGSLSGAPLAVTGPAAGLTVVVFDIVKNHGLRGLAIATVVCGVVQLLFGHVKLGALFQKVPHAVLDGMLASIGIMIAIGQVFVVLGLKIPNGFIAACSQLPASIVQTFGGKDTYGVSGILIAAVTISSQLGWDHFAGKLKSIPGAVVALVLGAIVSLPFDVARVVVHFDVSTMAQSILVPSASDFNSAVLLSGVVLALIGSIESLSTASALGLYARSVGREVKQDLNKELKAQGVGNLLSGILGGIPVTAVIVRSAANIQFGAKSRQSTILHGLWILLSVIILRSVLSYIPLPALAAILIVTGLKLLKPKLIINLWQNNRMDFVGYVATFGGIVSTNLLKGIVFGVTVTAVLKFLKSRGALVESLQRAS
jgi:MFS superfamily sulfate permease-like transporter